MEVLMKSNPLNSLVGNINKRKKLGISRPKSKSTVDPNPYSKLKRGWK